MELRGVRNAQCPAKFHAGMGTSVKPMVEVILALGNNPQRIGFDSEPPGGRFAFEPGDDVGGLTQRDATCIFVAVDSTIGAKDFWLMGIDHLLSRICAELEGVARAPKVV